MRCAEVLRRIGDYADGELDAAVARRVEAHLAMCRECFAALDELRRETAVYAAFGAEARRDLEFDAALWRGIERRIESVRPAGAGWFQSLAFRPSWRMAPVAAALALFLAGGYVALRLARTQHSATPRPNEVAVSTGSQRAISAPSGSAVSAPSRRTVPAPAAPGAAVGGKPALREAVVPSEPETGPASTIAQAEREYREAIRLLNLALRERKESLDPQLRRAFERNLSVVDGTIAATRRAYFAHPEDIDLADYLLAAYARKLKVLEEMTS